MRVLHPIGRISTLNRSNMILLRQIESACLLSPAHASHNRHMSGMTKPDPTLAQIAAQFARHDIEWSRGAYMIIDRRTANPIARLRPIPDTDRFELFYSCLCPCLRRIGKNPCKINTDSRRFFRLMLAIYAPVTPWFFEAIPDQRG